MRINWLERILQTVVVVEREVKEPMWLKWKFTFVQIQ